MSARVLQFTGFGPWGVGDRPEEDKHLSTTAKDRGNGVIEAASGGGSGPGQALHALRLAETAARTHE